MTGSISLLFTTMQNRLEMLEENFNDLIQSFNRRYTELDNHIYELEQTIDMLKKDIAILQYEKANK